MTENNDGVQGNTETPEQHFDAAFKAAEAWQATPSDETKKAFEEARAKALESYGNHKKTIDETLAKHKPPETYDLKLGEGSKLDAKAVEDIAAFAKSNGLSQDAAKALLERENANFEAYVDAVTAQQKAQLEAEQAEWIKTIETDTEIGGANAKKNMELAKRVVEKYGPEGFAKQLDETGLGNHPGLVKLIVRILKAANFSEDTLVAAPTAPPGERLPTTKVLFPSMEAK